ncbi:MAG: AzlD domain-containing protein [Spirochaetota bacterium]
MTWELVFVIVGMTSVTYVPRLVPLLMRRSERIPPWQARALRLVPITAVGALLIPDGLTAVGGNVDLSLIGVASAAALALLVRQPFVVVVGSVAIVVFAITLGV